MHGDAPWFTGLASAWITTVAQHAIRAIRFVDM
jgi:hypothetical protein